MREKLIEAGSVKSQAAWPPFPWRFEEPGKAMIAHPAYSRSAAYALELLGFTERLSLSASPRPPHQDPASSVPLAVVPAGHLLRGWLGATGQRAVLGLSSPSLG